jgi:hypothetical protein
VVFLAQYHGRCPACGDEIDPGDEVTYNRDDELVHDDCDDEPDDDLDPHDPFVY